MRRYALLLISITGAAASAQERFFPYTEVVRGNTHGAEVPYYGGSIWGYNFPAAQQIHNPCHPDADYDGDGIANRFDNDADGDTVVNSNDVFHWTRPSENTFWVGPIPWWDQYMDGSFPPDPCPSPRPSGPLFSRCADPDGDGLPVGADYDADNDGIQDIYDIDHYLYRQSWGGSDWDGDGLVDGPSNTTQAGQDDDNDGDGVGNEWDANDRKYQPRPNATILDWDGDGLPNDCDPEPKNPFNVLEPDGDLDGDGIPNRCDPEPCVPAPANDDFDGDGWPNRCDPDPCVANDPPANPDDPCGDDPDGDGWPDPPGGGGNGEPPDGSGDPPPPKADPSPPADIPPADPPPAPPPDLPPSVPPPPTDDECCEAITTRLDVLIDYAYQQTSAQISILNSLQRFTGGDGAEGRFNYMVRRLLTDPDSFRNRTDDSLYTIMGYVYLIKESLAGDTPSGNPPPNLTLPDWEETIGGVESAAQTAISDAQFAMVDIDDRTDATKAPAWTFDLQLPPFAGIVPPELGFTVNWDFYAPVRPLVHAGMIFLVSIQCIFLVWEELRRYG